MKRTFTLLAALFLFLPTFATGPKVGLNIGNKAPEIKESGLNGEKISLSELKGKIVLIDFWASWCGPCRRENPVVVSAYNKYKDKSFSSGSGFEVFSVSLDRNKANWERAINADQLTWKYHVSDLNFWNSHYAKVYNIRSIPTNYLIDGNGIIIAKNLRGHTLEAKLKELASEK